MKALCIVPTYGHFDYALEAVRSFLATVPDSQAAVIDDGSPDWDRIDWRAWPPGVIRHRFPKNDRNLTRSWNFGLNLARDLKAEYAIAGNSDLLFPSGWWAPVEEALRREQLHLAGPLTNAPGPRQEQQVGRYLDSKGYRLTDDPHYLEKVVRRLRERHKGQVKLRPINGYCMAARTSSWWQGRHNDSCVFDPANKMTKNEDELLGRWKRRGLLSGIVLSSFVFHFRGVSRNPRFNMRGAFRKDSGSR